MGNGSFKGEKFKLFATFLYDAQQQNYDDWEIALKAASKVLFDATDGQMSIGEIVVSNNLQGFANSDILIDKNVGDSVAVGTLKPNAPNQYVILKHDERTQPGVVVHEFGHYLLGLEDEYRLTGLHDGVCTGNAAGENACLMEFTDEAIIINSKGQLEGLVSEFCCEANHGSKNLQEKHNKESCWNTIVRNWGEEGEWGSHDIIGPVTGDRPTEDPPLIGPDELKWTKADDGSLFAFVLRKDDQPPLQFDKLLTTTFAPLAALETNPKFIIYRGDLDGETAGKLNEQFAAAAPKQDLSFHALTFGRLLRQIRQAPKANQRLLWLGADSSLADSEVPGVAARFRRSGYLVHLLASPRGPASMQRLALETNGVSRLLFQGNNEGAQIHATAQALSTTFDMLEHWSKVDEFQSVLRGEPLAESSQEQCADPYSNSDLERVSKRPLGVDVLECKYFDLPVYVEQDAVQVAFAICRPNAEAARLYVQRPNGEVVAPNELDEFLQAPQHQLFVIKSSEEKPLCGRWVMRVERDATENDTPFQLIAFSKNSGIQTHMRISMSDANDAMLRLEVSAQATLPIRFLEPVVAVITAYAKTGEELDSLRVPLDAQGVASGIYAVEMPQPTCDLARFQVRLANTGRALLVEGGSAEVPAFTRVLEQFLGTP